MTVQNHPGNHLRDHEQRRNGQLPSTTVRAPSHVSDHDWTLLREVLDTAITGLRAEVHDTFSPDQRHERQQRQLLLQALRGRVAGSSVGHRVAFGHIEF